MREALLKSAELRALFPGNTGDRLWTKTATGDVESKRQLSAKEV